MNKTAGWLVVLGAALAGCGGSDDERTPDLSEMSEGQALYVVNCAMCHGEAGLGAGAMAASLPVEPPSLLDHLGHHPEEQLIRIVRNGVPPAMPPAALSDDEVRLVIDYAWTLVPDSLIEGLREMQRMAEMGMDMEGMGGGMEMDPSGAMAPMGGDSTGHVMPRDTTRK